MFSNLLSIRKKVCKSSIYGTQRKEFIINQKLASVSFKKQIAAAFISHRLYRFFYIIQRLLNIHFRRGKGTFRSVMNAMEILKQKKLVFGTSCCYTRKNAETIGSEEYIDSMIEWGAKFARFFTYMPVGVNAVPDLIATAEQREFMYHQIRKFRKTKPYLLWISGMTAST